VAYHAVGPITLPAKKTVDLWMAVLAGDDLTQLLSTASVATADMNTRAAKIGDDDEDESGAKPFTASLSSKEPRVEKPYHVNRQPGADEH
jgi:hypothetical protein